ncbi:MAG TPA: hypothetical protein VMF03_14815 [Steroidobacteraceae bacterium]|nr:hypothetical protein [Steroidobacteraceae bacterium]
MKRLIGMALCALCAGGPLARADSYFVNVAGLGGEADYEQRFEALAADLDRIARQTGPGAHVTTLSGAQATRGHLQQVLRDIADQAHPDDVLVITLVGHGSFDGTQYKFNLPGPDLSAEQLASWCERIPASRQLIVNTTSASGGSVKALQRHDRVVVAATKTGTEKNATVFARYWVEALQDPGADTDKNQVITALEAFSYAARKTAAFYETEKRLATEHAVFEEGGRSEPVRTASADGDAGRMLASFALVRLGGTATTSSDPAKLALLKQKEQLEQKIDLLKYQRAAMSPEDYRSQLTQALVALAKVQQELDK